MSRDILTSAIAIVVFTVLLGLVYPLVITGVSQVAFPGNANGQKVYVDGKLVGSKIIGQSFARPVIGKNGKPEESKKNWSPKPTRATSRRVRRRPKAALQRRGEHVLQPRPNSVKTEEADAENIKAYLELNGRTTPA